MREVVGEASVRAGGPGDIIAGTLPTTVVAPVDERQVAAVLSCANDAGMAVIPRGGGTKLGWGNPPTRADVLLSLARLDRVLEHAWADMTVTVEAGCTVARLQETLAEHGQRLAIDVLWPRQATIGGILATNDSGALRLRFGGLRDLVIGMTLALPDGTLARSGGKVVKNVAGYDLPKLATGALGTLGVITQATFRLHPVPRNSRTLSFLKQSPAEAERLVQAIQDSKLAHVALQVRTVDASDLSVDVLLEGTESGVDAQAEALRGLGGGMQEVGQADVWHAREQLWEGPGAVLKISVAQSEMVGAVERIRTMAQAQGVDFQAVVYAHGIGWARLHAAISEVSAVLLQLRQEIGQRGGSLVVARQPDDVPGVDAWGEVGDALPLMRAVKQQLDPQGIMNPGRFVGGI